MPICVYNWDGAWGWSSWWCERWARFWDQEKSIWVKIKYVWTCKLKPVKETNVRLKQWRLQTIDWCSHCQGVSPWSEVSYPTWWPLLGPCCRKIGWQIIRNWLKRSKHGYLKAMDQICQDEKWKKNVFRPNIGGMILTLCDKPAKFKLINPETLVRLANISQNQISLFLIWSVSWKVKNP